MQVIKGKAGALHHTVCALVHTGGYSVSRVSCADSAASAAGGAGRLDSPCVHLLIVSCPCALVISVPLGFFGGIGAASKIGVLVKGANFIEAVSEMDTLIFDKTGTLTRGEFVVHQILPSEESGLTSRELLALAAEAEQFSSHPIAQSVKHAWGCRFRGSNRSGGGDLRPRNLRGGGRNQTLGRKCSADAAKRIRNFQCAEGRNGAVPGKGGSENRAKEPEGGYLGAIVIADRVKEGALEALRELRESGIRRMVMLSGDRREAAETIAQSLGIDEVYSELLPADKVGKVEELLKAQEAEKPSDLQETGSTMHRS